MTKFVYKAKSDPVQVIEGAIDAGSEEEAVNKLSLIGYFPFSVTSEGISAKEGIFHKKISGKDILNFTQQLSNLLESRINIIKAFYIISGQTHNRNLKILVEELLQKIKQGSSFSESLSSYPRLFSSFYVSMIRTGEASGRLEETLNKLALFLNKKQDFKRSLIEAMIYPAFVILVSIVTVFTLLTFVTPRILGLFSELNQNLPLPTKILIFISNAAINYWWLLASVLISFALVFKRIYGQEKEKIRLDQLFLKAPVIGSMIFKQQAARVMNTLSILISSGLPLLESLNISISSLQNAYLKNEFSK